MMKMETNMRKRDKTMKKSIKLSLLNALKNGDIIDRNEYFNKYSVVKYDINGDTDWVIQPYKLLQGAPIIVCIEGHYVKVDSLPGLCINRSDRKNVINWVNDCHNNLAPGGEMNFEWKR